jgi:hypothetical protein
VEQRSNPGSGERIAEAVTASGTSLTEIHGVGPIIAAIVIDYTGEIARFPSSGHHATYNGTAPIEFSSTGAPCIDCRGAATARSVMRWT